MLARYKFHILIILIGLCCLFGINYFLQISSQNIIYPDTFAYHDAAKNLYVFYRGHNYRPMLLAAIHGLPYLFGATDQAIFEFSFYLNLYDYPLLVPCCF
jgi:hypothetical protein